MALLRRFIREEAGLETVEYAVIGALVVAIAATTISGLGSAVNGKLIELTNKVNGQ